MSGDRIMDHDIATLERMTEDIRRIRYRTCEPKENTNRRYHALSSAVSSLLRATDDRRAEDAPASGLSPREEP